MSKSECGNPACADDEPCRCDYRQRSGMALCRSLDEAIDDLAREAFADLCEGDGQHSEALDLALLRKHLHAARLLHDPRASSMVGSMGNPDSQLHSQPVQFGCYECKASFSHEPLVINEPGCPAITYLFCSPSCRLTWSHRGSVAAANARPTESPNE